MEPAFELQQDIFQDKIIKYRSEAFEKGILGYTAQQHYVVPKLLEEFADLRIVQAMLLFGGTFPSPVESCRPGAERTPSFAAFEQEPSSIMVPS